jgi:hypothetical protein
MAGAVDGAVVETVVGTVEGEGLGMAVSSE